MRETLRVVSDMLAQGTPPLQPDTTPPAKTLTADNAVSPPIRK
ncbi:hypothetical protein [Geminisphaera colitermitum]|nr:hypothetical protein [Geminisphaera colitermitum]